MGTLAPAAQYELPSAFVGIFSPVAGTLTFMLVTPTVLLVAGIPDDGSPTSRLYVGAFEIGGDGSLTPRGTAYAAPTDGAGWVSVTGVLMPDGTVLIPIVTQPVAGGQGLSAIVVTWDNPGVSLSGLQALVAPSSDNYYRPYGLLNPDGNAEVVSFSDFIDDPYTETVRRISVVDTVATLFDTYTFEIAGVPGSGVNAQWAWTSEYGSHCWGTSYDYDGNPTAVFATRAWGSTTVEYFGVGAGIGGFLTSLGGETYAMWSAPPIMGSSGTYWVVTKDGVIASSSTLDGQDWFGQWPPTTFDLTNQLAFYLSETSLQGLTFALAEDGTPVESTIEVVDIIDYAEDSLDDTGVAIFPVLQLPGYWAVASGQWITILHPYVVKTTQLVPLRRGKRNDGLGPSGHPRLRSSGTMTSTQLASAPRVGGGNLYS